MCDFFVFGNNLNMFGKKYVQSAKTAILNRVKFHAPIVFDDKLNLKVFLSHGVDVRLPVFVFDKELNRRLLRAFELALREENFNLLFSQRSVGNLQKKVEKKLPNAVIFDQNASGAFLEGICKLNINYAAASNYNLTFRDKFFKLNGQILNPHFDDFSLKLQQNLGNLAVSYDEFVLNGVNYVCSLKNMTGEEVRAEIELNIPLKKGYYYFKKLSRAVLIENLLSKQKTYLNFICKNAKFSFSNVDGLENSVFSCINVKASINFSPHEEKFVFFNFGGSRFLPTCMSQIRRLQALAWQKSCENFDLQIKTKNPKFDFFFNKTLPQKIWLNWLNGESDEQLEQKYVTYRKLFLKGSLKFAEEKMNRNIKQCGKENGARLGDFDKAAERKAGALSRNKLFEEPAQKGLTLVNFEKIGLRELGIFNGEYYKKIYVVKGQEKFLKVGKTFFYNICGITEHSLRSREPISVCFGE